MKYFINTEFLEGKQDKRFLGIKYGETKPTIDLISIGIVGEDDREYYAISKDFNLKEAWNRYDIAEQTMFEKQNGFKGRKVYWLRDNVLKPIYNELILHHTSEDWYHRNVHFGGKVYNSKKMRFDYKSLEWLINKYGKTNKQIAEEVKQFCLPTRGFLRDNYELKNSIFDKSWDFTKMNTYEKQFDKEYESSKHPEFYAYYADYDWVAFCWLFGKMIDLPNGFPMYCIDVKQVLDEKVNELYDEKGLNKKLLLEGLKDNPDYPKQTNEHNALSDALFCKELYYFINFYNNYENNS